MYTHCIQFIYTYSRYGIEISEEKSKVMVISNDISIHEKINIYGNKL